MIAVIAYLLYLLCFVVFGVAVCISFAYVVRRRPVPVRVLRCVWVPALLVTTFLGLAVLADLVLFA